MQYRGQSVRSVVAIPVDDFVVGVHVASLPHILPRVEAGDIPPPVIPQCFDRHVIRTSNSVVIVEVQAQVMVFPRSLTFAAVEESARNSLLAALEADNITPSPRVYAQSLRDLTQRLIHQMRLCGVEIA